MDCDSLCHLIASRWYFPLLALPADIQNQTSEASHFSRRDTACYKWLQRAPVDLTLEHYLEGCKMKASTFLLWPFNLSSKLGPSSSRAMDLLSTPFWGIQELQVQSRGAQPFSLNLPLRCLRVDLFYLGASLIKVWTCQTVQSFCIMWLSITQCLVSVSPSSPGVTITTWPRD